MSKDGNCICFSFFHIEFESKTKFWNMQIKNKSSENIMDAKHASLDFCFLKQSDTMEFLSYAGVNVS